jgi:hypothetical protein
LCFFVHALSLFYVVKNASRTRQQSHPQQTRDRKKALVKRKKPVRVYQRSDVVIGHGIVGKDIPIMARLAEARRWSKR